MGRKKRRVLTDKELVELEAYSRIRLPMDDIAHLFGMGKDTLERILTKQEAARAAVEQGRASGARAARQTLYGMAMGTRGGRTADGVLVPPKEADFHALRFWCQSQEGMSVKNELEISSKDDVSGLTDEEADERLRRLELRMLARKNAKPR